MTIEELFKCIKHYRKHRWRVKRYKKHVMWESGLDYL